LCHELNAEISGASEKSAAAWGRGRYDDLKSADENIDLQSTILSRFDLIFIVKDERNAERDMQIARRGPPARRLRPPGRRAVARAGSCL
jgi:DNA replicative helicase MCM subunit Mcm2 (Cdc46/Mcm family)